MQARAADAEGFIEHLGVKVHYEIHGERGPTILLLPTWTVIHKRFWKAQIPYLSRHFRVVTYDGPGNGRSDRPTTSEEYGQAAQVGYALAVLDASGTDRAVVVGLSRAANWALELAAEHPSRVHGTVLVGPAVALAARDRRPAVQGPSEDAGTDLGPSIVPQLGTDPDSHWAKYARGYWLENYEDFLWFFFGRCFGEPHSTKQIEDAVGWGLETTAEVLVAESRAGRPDQDTIERWCARVTSPVLVIHGTDDRVRPAAIGERIAELTGGRLELLAGSGHVPMARDPVRVNLLVAEFAERFRPSVTGRRTWHRSH